MSLLRSPWRRRSHGRGLWKFTMITFLKKFLDPSSRKLAPCMEYDFPFRVPFSFLSVSPSPVCLESLLEHVLRALCQMQNIFLPCDHGDCSVGNSSWIADMVVLYIVYVLWHTFNNINCNILRSNVEQVKPSQEIPVTCLVSLEEVKDFNFNSAVSLCHKAIDACLPRVLKVWSVNSVPHKGTGAFCETGQLIWAKPFHVFFKVYLLEILSDCDSWWHKCWARVVMPYCVVIRSDFCVYY